MAGYREVNDRVPARGEKGRKMNTLDRFEERFTGISNICYILIGNLIYAFSVNMMITPAGLYNGGFLGIAQLLRYLFTQVLMVPIPQGMDITGIIYFVLNVPLFLYSYKVMGRSFSAMTILSIGISSLFFSFVPVPEVPLVEDRLTACVVGGVIGGIGTGLILRGGSSTGGSDIIGVCLSKTHPDMSVGKINIGTNLIIYAICLAVFDVQTAIYSFIYTTVRSTYVDRMHTQNINVCVKIVTKEQGIDQAINEKMNRGVTVWTATGAYTGDDVEMLYTVVSRYELHHLVGIVREIDKKAFITYSDGEHVIGNYISIIH